MANSDSVSFSIGESITITRERAGPRAFSSYGNPSRGRGCDLSPATAPAGETFVPGRGGNSSNYHFIRHFFLKKIDQFYSIVRFYHLI